MAYVAPPTWITGHIVTAAELNQYLNANLASLKAEKLDVAALAAALAPYMEGVKVNGLYFSTSSTNPATSLGYGTWEAYAAGRIPIGVGTSDVAYGAGATGGASTHTNTVAEMATHTHVQNAHNHTVAGANSTASVSITGEAYTTVLSDPMSLAVSNTTPTNQNAGSGTAYNNMPPWIGVYIFRRTA